MAIEQYLVWLENLFVYAHGFPICNGWLRTGAPLSVTNC